MTNETFYRRKSSSFIDEKIFISSEVYIAYSQFVSDVIRQLIDEIPLGFNLTIYADQIDRYVVDYFQHFERPYQALAFHLGDPSALQMNKEKHQIESNISSSVDELKKSLNELTKSMRQVQNEIDQIEKTE